MSDETTPPKPEPRPPGSKRRRVVLALVVPMFALLAAALWLTLSESGMRAAAALAQQASGGALDVQGASGRLIGPLRIEHLRYADADLRIDARELAFDWQPVRLLNGALELSAVSLASLDVATRPTDTPAHLPAEIALPFVVREVPVSLGRLCVQGWLADAALPAPMLAEFRALSATVASDGRHHHVTALRGDTPFGHAEGEATLDGQAPFALKAAASLRGAREDKQYEVNATAGGTLAAIDLAARAAGWNLTGEATIALTPFAPVPVRSAHVSVGELDPAAFNAGAPRAALQITADIAPVASARAPAALEDWVIAGPVTVSNRTPGPFDQSAIPFTSLTAQAVWRQGELTLQDVRLTPAGRTPGSVTGNASMRTRGEVTVSAALKLAGVDANQWVSVLKPARVSGDLKLAASASAQSLEARLNAPAQAGAPAWQGEALLTHREARLELARARLAAEGATLDAKGHLLLAGTREFALAGELARFDPGLYVNAPHAALNAVFDARGNLKPQPVANVSFDLRDSKLITREASLPLTGKGELALEKDRLSRADVALDLAGNRLMARGALGRAGDRLALELDAPRLDALGMGLGGTATAHGELVGSFAQPAGKLDAQLANLRAPGGVRADKLTLAAQLAEGAEGRFAATLDAAGLRANQEGRAIEQAHLTLAGTRGAHTLEADAKLGGQDALLLAAHGALTDGPQWRGTLDKFDLRFGEDHPVLVAPAALELAPGRAVLGAAELRGKSARMKLHETRWVDGALRTRGEATGVLLGVALDAQQRATLRGRSLAVGGAWDITADAHVNGTLTLRREAGDIEIAGDAPVTLGLREVELKLDAVQDRVTARLAANGDRLGQINARAATNVERAGSLWRVAHGAPLDGEANFAVPALNWVAPLIDPNLQLSGAMGGVFTLAGSVDKPDARGNLRVVNLNLALVEQGLRLTDGDISIDLTQDRATLGAFSFRADPRVRPREVRVGFAEFAGKPGRVSGTGEIELATGKGAIRLNAERLAVLQRPDRWLVASGDVLLETTRESLAVSGALRADAGYVELAGSAPPRLSDDVVVSGRQSGNARPFRLDVDLTADLGPRMIFKGRGLDTRLEGSVRLRTDARGTLRANGSIATREGTFDAYGQYLTIERGILNFQGPVDNAGLNVLALRKGLAVEAGVEVTGTVAAPKVRLVSEPNVPDAEKLSWIVLGRGQDTAGGTDSALLLSAAGAILGGQSGGISRQLAQGLGLDQVSVARGDVRGVSGAVTGSSVVSSTLGSRDPSLSTEIVTVGKRLSADAYLSYEQGLAGAASVVKLTYSLTRRLSVIGRAGTDNSLDLFYSFSFR